MKTGYIFLLSSGTIAALLFLLPINLFDGEIVVQNSLQTVTEKAPLSLSYFIGMGYDVNEMENIKSFRLLPAGYLMAVIFILGIPALIAYRVHLGRTKRKNE
jgi:hypothetical protein